ncbi:NAD-dependent epimerase/dehydratase family protein [Polynucleobacter sp. AP-Elch-400A-B2]|jgi:2-alkyl-3-oxoalkanoate reductase|uniref:NAD-dependent epimerase/dehydratase family protein n=1 Tax=Polynucleobacter sp. AP-Elch-400A-B2 TaxID=2576930 RepID=UPI001BFEE374|nr:NAD-dependent epimerase/dehydratase family protein [Polynucleobacter sp. AP-Elch-400A-B2]QWE24046.1 NAD-dependent epimerase/dehydratase family protein [Polynucleobacter sp. AP-Elch-400A-B2]
MKIFLTGASGFVGSHLTDSLIAEGHELVSHFRKPQTINIQSHSNTAVWSGSLNDVEGLSKRLHGLDVVIHCAAEMKLWNSEKSLLETNVFMTKNILESSRRASIKQFIYMSDASIAKNPLGQNLNISESRALPSLQNFPYSHSKSQAEQWVLEAGDETFRTLSLRPATIWGRGDVVDQILGRAADLNKFGWFDQGDYLFSTCYIQNLCEAVNKSLLSDSNQESFFISDGPPMQFRQWMSTRLKAGHYKVPTLSIPRFFARPLAHFAENGWKYLPLRGEPPLIREMVHLMAHPFSVSIQKAKDQLGYEPLYAMEDGMLEIEKAADQ